MPELKQLSPILVSQRRSNLEKFVGNTPLLPILNISKNLNPKVKIFAKAEWVNPSGSIKDRPALNIINQAVEHGHLKNGIRLLDSTSGNMGIAYATLCASMDIGVTITMPSNASEERITILKSLGAELILTDPLEGSDGAMEKARELAKEFPEKYYYANQYNNPANWEAHYENTGPEIWEETYGKITHFIAGLGTSGTFTGVTRFLKIMNKDLHSIAFQPESPLHGLEGLKHMPSSQKPGIFNDSLPDDNMEVKTEDAYDMLKKLSLKEGLFVGISSAAAIFAAIRVAEKLDQGFVVTILPDSGLKYLSENIWKF